MATGISTYLANKLLEHALGKTEYTMPTVIYCAAFVGDPGGAGSEVSGGGYARQQVTIDAATAAAASNSQDILFPEATADWGTIDYLCLFDAASSGNTMFYGALSTAKAIGTSDQLKIAAGNFDLSFS